jgi:hypothetical protein
MKPMLLDALPVGALVATRSALYRKEDCPCGLKGDGRERDTYWQRVMDFGGRPTSSYLETDGLRRLRDVRIAMLIDAATGCEIGPDGREKP